MFVILLLLCCCSCSVYSKIVLNSISKFKHISSCVIISTFLSTYIPIHIDSLNFHNNAIAAVETTELSRLKIGYNQLRILLRDWDERTNYCVFGEIKKELLSADNKQELIEEAKFGSTLDKNPATVNIKCKRDPEVVRQFLGLGNEPVASYLKNAELLLKKPSTLELVDPDNIDKYFDALENFSQSMAAADGLSYAARTDYSSTENTTKGDTSMKGSSKEDYLAKTKTAVANVLANLNIIVDILKL